GNRGGPRARLHGDLRARLQRLPAPPPVGLRPRREQRRRRAAPPAEPADAVAADRRVPGPGGQRPGGHRAADPRAVRVGPRRVHRRLPRLARLTVAAGAPPAIAPLDVSRAPRSRSPGHLPTTARSSRWPPRWTAGRPR